MLSTVCQKACKVKEIVVVRLRHHIGDGAAGGRSPRGDIRGGLRAVTLQTRPGANPKLSRTADQGDRQHGGEATRALPEDRRGWIDDNAKLRLLLPMLSCERDEVVLA